MFENISHHDEADLTKLEELKLEVEIAGRFCMILLLIKKLHSSTATAEKFLLLWPDDLILGCPFLHTSCKKIDQPLTT